MDQKLNVVEIRVLGALIEKDLSTPDYYPLSINALTNACNQKNNRDPVMSLSEAEVLDAVNSLITKHMARALSIRGSRVKKYAHSLFDRLTEKMNFTKEELAILGELMCRGPQTPGELRSRAARMREFQSLEKVLEVLCNLRERTDGPYVIELPRQAGRREARYAQLFCEESVPQPPSLEPPISSNVAGKESLEQRVEKLETMLEALCAEIDELKRGASTSHD